MLESGLYDYVFSRSWSVVFFIGKTMSKTGTGMMEKEKFPEIFFF